MLLIHLVYQENGRILGHISMIRLYEKAWLIQHHAARAGENTRSKRLVLKQLFNFLHDKYRLPSSKMDYVVSYFRPSDKSLNRFLMDFAQFLGNRNQCSLDLFSYFSFPVVSLYKRLPDQWSLEPCSEIDLLCLEQFYRHDKGGLLVDAFCLNLQDMDSSNIGEDYEKLGLYREWRIYALKYQEELHAALIVNKSSLGLNLWELTNSIHVIITNREGLSWKILSTAIGRAAATYTPMQRIPVLIYPNEYLDLRNATYERQYYLWILNVLYGEKFLTYIEERLRLHSLYGGL